LALKLQFYGFISKYPFQSVFREIHANSFPFGCYVILGMPLNAAALAVIFLPLKKLPLRDMIILLADSNQRGG